MILTVTLPLYPRRLHLCAISPSSLRVESPNYLSEDSEYGAHLMEADLGYLHQYQRGDPNADGDGFLPKVTLFRLLVVFLTSSFGISKAWLSYHGYSTAPNTLDWLYGVLVFIL